MKNILNRISIHTQIRAIQLTLLLVCIGLGILINLTLHNTLLQTNRDYTYNVSQQFSCEMENLYDRITGIYQLQLYDSNIEEILLSPLSENSFNLYKYFSPLTGSNPDLADIALTNHAFHWSELYDNFTLNKMSSKINDTGVTSLGIYHPSYASNLIPHTANLVFGKRIYALGTGPQSGEPIGSMIISINPAKSSIVLPTTAENLATTFLMADKNGQYYSFDENFQDAGVILEACRAYMDSWNHEDNYMEFQTSEYHMTITYSPSMEYYLISAVNQEALYRTMRQTQTLVIIIWITLASFMLLLFWLVHRNIILPIRQLYGFMQSIRSGDRKKLKSSIELNGSKEIHSLGFAFNDMLNEVNSLNRQLFKTTTELYEAELQKQDAEIAHLRSQINPHFLYNTLEVMKGIALDNNVPQVAAISNSMGKIFRYTIKGASDASFGSELEIAKAYLQIQSIRFENRFQTYYSIEEGTETLSILKMLLQPIIENAIIHGLEGKTSPGILYIGAKTEGELFLITIQDDGVGIDETTLNNLLNQLHQPLLSPESNDHIGIINVHRRIRLCYGEAYGITIESIPGQGTLVTLKLPRITTK